MSPRILVRSANSVRTLTPGGYIEIIDMIFPVKCDDGSLAEHSALMEWTRKLSDTMERAGRPLDSALHYSKQLKGAGFEGVVEQRFKWPSNGWPKHPHKELGRQFVGSKNTTSNHSCV